MKELTKHIEALLVDNDCVILPNFGGFVTNHTPARWVEGEETMLPPYRTIGFNPQLKINDGLLVQSYMMTHDATYPEATRLAEAAIDRLSEELYKEGMVNLHGIGTLRRTLVGEYQFDPTEDGVITPALYGLGAVQMKTLAELEKELKAMPQTIVATMEKEDPAEASAPVIENKGRTITIKIRHEWIANAVSVAAAIMLFFFLSTPVENTYIEEENYASLGNINVFEQMKNTSLLTTLMEAPAEAQKSTAAPTPKPTQTKVAKAEVPVAKAEAPVAKAETPVAKPSPAKAEALAEKPAPVKTEVPTVKPAPVKTEAPATKPVQVKSEAPVAKPAPAKRTAAYNVIVASVPTENDAQPTIERLASKGYTGAFLIKGNGRFRIALKAYDTEAEAYSRVNELKQMGDIKDAWVLKTRN